MGGGAMQCLATLLSQPQVQTSSVPGRQDIPRTKSVWAASSCRFIRVGRSPTSFMEKMRRVRASQIKEKNSGLEWRKT